VRATQRFEFPNRESQRLDEKAAFGRLSRIHRHRDEVALFSAVHNGSALVVPSHRRPDRLREPEPALQTRRETRPHLDLLGSTAPLFDGHGRAPRHTLQILILNSNIGISININIKY